ncbi:transient receptor potential cation channel subfamily V member 2 [Rhinolophus ferrumequinum]|uniref:Transient receptor potential cation channel subfamily V member 2 n=1 Tax=Rhinolophus ferrumequinum TaxID=59479 RepID=A0A7J7THQ0_RHIFE|nr:transient receptor potential cation channel subfamily V member 2 [Rhinolophus ferrumequinum]XP_032946012.1 transient receptor potential cation channel subfamily V member 2 [Rhinolophus ferrumequinum]XP_032946013.1 transient receptor potential cation channel subfamily V member 2 [Rhinolophus ferrumequinum]KAF6300055.1 transient receptor potential cation channel subfamily V member 2 [Rhinolophus ferrumequinum]
MTSPSSPPAFRLETCDGGEEDGADMDKGKLGRRDGPPPMESHFQEEDRNFSPQIKVNLNYRGKGAGVSQPDPNRFDRDRLFSVVARGVPEELAGLLEYLRRTSKYLTDDVYTEGSTGKTCLMKAVLNLRDGANACILPLLQIDQDSGNPMPLVNAQCTDEYYQGHSALHIAIEKRSLQCVELLVENGADVHARACGHFFQKKSQGTCFYFGELPLSLAACTMQWDVVRYLLKNQNQPASLQATDSLGNTVLHALVMIADNSAENSKLVIQMYDSLLQAGADLCPTVQLEDISNLQGLTPLKLAAKEGKIEIFRHILQREFSGQYQPLSRKFTEWCYGPVRVSLYDLASVDSWEENSVLEVIAFHCRSPHRHRMVVLEPLNKLLQAKWDLLIPRFFFNFLCYLIYMFIFTAIAYHQPALEKAFLPMKVTAGNSMLLLGHILILFGGIYLLMSQLWYFWRRRLFIWISFMDSYFEILFLVQALLTVLSQVLCFLAIEWYLPLLVSSLVLGWLNLLYYTRGFQHTGIYSVMIQKVILRDLLRFLLVYLVFLFGFAVALVSLSREARDPGVPTSSNATEALRLQAGQEGEEDSSAPYGGILDASLELFKFTIGMGELAFQDQLRFRGVVLLLLLAYVLLTYVLLLNMLIALMSETVNSVSTDSWSIWKLQKAISVLEMENGYWWCKRKKQRAGVMLRVGTRLDGSADERWCFRVEEVNWAAWEKTLPTVFEEPSGPGIPGTMKNPAQPREDSALEEDHLPLRLLESH